MRPEDYARLDANDPLAGLRDAFDLPADTVYLDGNSLGALPAHVRTRLDRLVAEEWGRDLVSSWNRHDWIDLPQRVGDRIGRIVGAAAGQVICADSVSVNLFKLLAAALGLRPGRRVILVEEGDFPTDRYVAQGLSGLLGEDRCRIRAVPRDELPSALDEDVAVLMLTQVNFRDGRRHDVAELTTAAQAHGALALWDLSHSAGAMPLDLDGWNVDMAVGCGYKYLNGGPGAPAFLYLAERHQAAAAQPLSGWMGHRRAFDFEPGYEPAEGVARFLCGTPGILGMAALDAALDLFDRVTPAALRARSKALTGAFIAAVDGLDLPELRLLTPREPAHRGSQVSLAHPGARAIAQALIERRVIVDFRAPDIVRFGFSPFYTRYADVGLAAEALGRIVREETWREARFSKRQRVT
jgi:kynureninase